MSELISGKDALIALANGEEVEWRHPERDWFKAPQCNMRTQDFFSGVYQFRLKPRTTTLNGVEVEQLYSSQWCKEKPDEVTLKFKNKNAAIFFQSKALEIFNGIK